MGWSERDDRGNKGQRGKPLRAWRQELNILKPVHFSQVGGAEQKYRVKNRRERAFVFRLLLFPRKEMHAHPYHHLLLQPPTQEKPRQKSHRRALRHRLPGTRQGAVGKEKPATPSPRDGLPPRATATVPGAGKFQA